jgi:hypothetical protein
LIRDPSDGSVKARQATIKSLKAHYGENWGITPPPEPPKKPFKTMTAEELSEFYRNNPERIMRLIGEQDEQA